MGACQSPVQRFSLGEPPIPTSDGREGASRKTGPATAPRIDASDGNAMEFSVALDRAFSPLRCEKLHRNQGGHQLWQLLEPLTFDLQLAGIFHQIVVPADFVTDFASVPWFFRRLIPADGEWDEATVLHDWLCVYPGCPRVIADLMLLLGMVALRVPRWRRFLIYHAVRLYAVLCVRDGL